jgi:hypothetical protein
MPAHIAAALESGDLTWLRPAGLGSLADPIQELPEPLRRATTQ